MRLLLLPAVIAGLTIGSAAAAFVHLPKIALVQSDMGTQKVRTYGVSVGDALKDARVSLGVRDRVIPSVATPLDSGMTITVRRAFPVSLIADGRLRVVATSAMTVGEFLDEAGVAVQPADVTYPLLRGDLWPGARVRVVRMVTKTVDVAETLPFVLVTRPDRTLPQGAYRIVDPGQNGLRLHRVTVTTADGEIVDQRPLGTVMIRPAKDRVQVVGTLRIAASRGDLMGKEVMLMEATGYAPWHGKGVDDITAIGMRAGYGVVAVDPRVIPLRSVLYIEGYGMAVAGDTGGAIKGQRIDLGFPTARDAYRWGRRPARVYIISRPAARR